MTTLLRSSFFFILVVFAGTNAFSQKKNLAAEEDKLAKLYAKLTARYQPGVDSAEFYSNKFEKDITSLIQHDPGTLNYSFKKLIDNNYCQIATSQDGNFRIYTWDNGLGGTMRWFKEIYQWRANGKVFTKVSKFEHTDPAAFCSAMYTVQVNNSPVYLAIKNGIYSTKDVMQSVSAYRINGKLIDSVKLFKTKTEVLKEVKVDFDFFSVVDRPERPLKLITFDDKLNILYVPLVGDKDQITKKNLLYQLKGRYFEYIGIEAGRRRSAE